MINILILASFTFNVKSQDLDAFDLEADGYKNPSCKKPCSARFCNNAKTPFTDSRECSAYWRGEGPAVDPWLLASPRCQVTTCDSCGGYSKCVQLCEQFKTDNNIRKYPNCDDQCSEIDNDGFRCWIDLIPRGKTKAKWNKPECYPYRPCTEAYNSAWGKQMCTAANTLVDPWKCVNDVSVYGKAYKGCKIINNNKCGNHQECLQECEDFKTIRGDTTVDCKTECQAVKGYKCFIGCRKGKSKPENINDILAEWSITGDIQQELAQQELALGVNVNGVSNYNNYYWYALVGCILFLVFAVYKYRTSQGGVKVVSNTETDALLDDNYGSLSA